MVVQQRDREILRRCYEQQFLLVEHVQRYFFKDRSETKARERIRELEQAGWLRKERIAGLSHRKILRLTPTGARFAQSIRGDGIPQRRGLDLNTVEHDAIVTSVALRLLELWDGTWTPERAIDSGEFAHIPDGVFTFPDGRRVAVEVENSLKGRSRFLRILECWRQAEVATILYVTTSHEIARHLQGFISEGPRGIPFALVVWPELEAGTPTAWSTRGELDYFARRSL